MSTSQRDDQQIRKVILTALVTSVITAVVSTAVAGNFAAIVGSIYVQSVLRWLTSETDGLVLGVIAGMLALSWRLRRSDDVLVQLNGWVLLLAAGFGAVMQWKDDVWALVPENLVVAVTTGHPELIEIPPVMVEEPFFRWFGIALLAFFMLGGIFATIAMLVMAVTGIGEWLSDRRDERLAASKDANDETQSPPAQLDQPSLAQLDQPTLFDDFLTGSSDDSLAAMPGDTRVKAVT